MFKFLRSLFLPVPEIHSEPAMTNRMAEAILRGLLLDPRYRFRSLGKLASSIHQDVATTRAILTGIGARKSRRPRSDGREMWTIDNRVPVAVGGEIDD